MSGVKHTRGPWTDSRGFFDQVRVEFDGDGHYATLSSSVRDAPVAFVIGTPGRTWRNDEEQQANARLIAAAPDLLEALTEARLTLSLTRTNIMVEMKKSEGAAYRWEGVPELLANRIAQCDAAIQRATGDRPEKGGAL